MKTFVLLATIWTANAPPSVYVLDSGLTGEDCIEAMQDGATVAMLDNGNRVDLSKASLSCEFDLGDAR